MNRTEARLAGNESAALVTRAELAAAWGVSRPAISKLFKRPGAPAFVAGKIALADAEAWRAQRRRKPEAAARPVVAELVDGDADIGEARRQQEIIKARLLDIEYRRALGALVPREEVAATAREDGARIRAALMAMPSRLAPTLADAAAGGGVPAVATALEADVRLVLESLSALPSLDLRGGPAK
jgi:hypothetical protein